VAAPRCSCALALVACLIPAAALLGSRRLLCCVNACDQSWQTIIADGSVAVFGKLFFRTTMNGCRETAGSDFAVTLARPTRDREAPNRALFRRSSPPDAQDDTRLVGHRGGLSLSAARSASSPFRKNVPAPKPCWARRFASIEAISSIHYRIHPHAASQFPQIRLDSASIDCDTTLDASARTRSRSGDHEGSVGLAEDALEGVEETCGLRDCPAASNDTTCAECGGEIGITRRSPGG
jgi:hypothetical protein